MDIADTHRQKIDLGILDESTSQFRIGQVVSLCDSWASERQVANLSFYGGTVAMSKVSEGCDSRPVVFIGCAGICRHDQIESGQDCVAHPVVIRTLVKDESTRDARVSRPRFS